MRKPKRSERRKAREVHECDLRPFIALCRRVLDFTRDWPPPEEWPVLMNAQRKG
jgi:hypothetical protein